MSPWENNRKPLGPACAVRKPRGLRWQPPACRRRRRRRCRPPRQDPARPNPPPPPNQNPLALRRHLPYGPGPILQEREREREGANHRLLPEAAARRGWKRSGVPRPRARVVLSSRRPAPKKKGEGTGGGGLTLEQRGEGRKLAEAPPRSSPCSPERARRRPERRRGREKRPPGGGGARRRARRLRLRVSRAGEGNGNGIPEMGKGRWGFGSAALGVFPFLFPVRPATGYMLAGRSWLCSGAKVGW